MTNDAHVLHVRAHARTHAHVNSLTRAGEVFLVLVVSGGAGALDRPIHVVTAGAERGDVRCIRTLVDV